MAVRYLGPKRAALNVRARLFRRGWNPARYRLRRNTDLAYAGRPRVALRAAPGSARFEWPARRFTVFERSQLLGSPPNWEPPEDLLWLFNLHYFAYLDQLPPAARITLAHEWVEGHPPDSRRPGWRPYALSLRLRNWTRALFAAGAPMADDQAREILGSIEAQGEALANGVERYLGANHLFENAVTLKFLSGTFSGSAVSRWKAIADPILLREVDEQFLPDGGHFERSPMYHALLVEGLLDLVNVLSDDDPVRRLVGRRLPSLLAYLRTLVHPDGAPPLFNDSVFDVAPPPAGLLAYAAELGLCVEGDDSLPAESGTVTHFPATGYHVWRARGAAFFYDAGPVGPDYQPAHAHGDMFSYELSAGGRRLVVDGGTSTYEAGPERDWVRSTAAHNTVEIDGQSQCEFFDAFRVGRRGRPKGVVSGPEEEGLHVRGWHDGYERLRGGPRHHREIRFLPSGVLLVWDEIRSRRAHRAVSRVRFAPGTVVEPEGTGVFRVRLEDMLFKVIAYGGELHPEPTVYAPQFGARHSCVALALTKGPGAEFGYALSPAGIDVAIDARGARVGGVRIERAASGSRAQGS